MADAPVVPPLALPEVPDGPWRRTVPTLPTGAFPAASLGAWLAIAGCAGVRRVPARRLGALPIEDLLSLEDAGHEGAARAMDQLSRWNRGLEEGHMLRWDCCAGLDLKLAASDGRPASLDECKLDPLEPRTADLLLDFPHADIQVWQRPWIQAQQVDGFPLEFRAFIANGEVVGLANYYLQRPLEPTDALRQAASKALGASRRIAAQLAQEPLRPAMPGMSVADLARVGIHATVDLLIDPAGEAWCLEAGPGFGFGAHPCAFLQPAGAVAPLRGMAWASGRLPGPLPG